MDDSCIREFTTSPSRGGEESSDQVTPGLTAKLHNRLLIGPKCISLRRERRHAVRFVPRRVPQHS